MKISALRRSAPALAMLAALPALGAQDAPPAPATALSQIDIVKRHMAAVNDKDIEGAMADYAEDAVMIQPGKVTEGKAAIRALFLAGFARVPADASLGMVIERTWQEGRNVVSAPWHKGTDLNGIDKFLMRDGKIIVQTVFLSGQPPAPTAR